jgi:anti-anti-sigma regulatory factor
MDAAHAQPPQLPGAAPGAAPPKLAIDKFADGGIVCLRLSGTIDESFEGKKLAETTKAQTLVLDLGDIRKVSSFGIREWVDFINGVGKHSERIVLVECAPKIVDQLNMVANFAGTGRVYSFYAPYHCDYCDKDDRVLYQIDRDHEVIKSMKPPQRPCTQCGEMQYFNEDPVTFFSYLAGQEKFELDPDVAAFLASKLSYAVSDSARKLRIDKIIEGRTTFVRLGGDLEKSFPREKLAEGVEGVVVIDVAGIGKIEPAGAAEWRGFLQMVTPGAEALYLTGVPPAFLDKLTRPEDLGPKAQVLSFTLPYTCATCSTTAGQLIDVDEHFDVLKFATPPDLKCPDCKSALVCAAPEGLLTHLPSLPRPTVTSDFKKLIAELRARKIQVKKVATTVAEAAAQQKGGGVWMAFTAAAATVVLAGGAFFIYKSFLAGDGKVAAVGRGKKTGGSADVRPAWIGSDAALAAYCTDEAGGGLTCVGVSGLAPSSDDAIDEAGDAALDAIAGAVATRIDDPAWRTRVGNLYAQARQAKLAAADKDPRSAAARREVRESRRAVAKTLRATSGGAVPAAPAGRYWEEYQNGNADKQYVGFASFSLQPAEVKRLVDGYKTPSEALGAKAVTVFPQLAWRYPEVTRGAVLVSVDEGLLQKAGLAASYVVLEIGGRDVVDAAAFASLSGEEMTRLKATGGTLAVEVQAGDGDPKSFATPVTAIKAVDPTGRDPGGREPGGRNSSGSGGTGNVNVWDRYGGGGATGRDDPTQ